MRAMILAAGFGTRFRPVTHSLPKPMIPVLNRPLLGWAVNACLEAGFHEVIVNLHHLADPIRAYLEETFGNDASFELSEEEQILGTGGALRRVRDLLDEEFVLMNGDTIQWPPFEALVSGRRERNALACLLLRHAPPGETFTRVWLDDGEITGFGEGRGEPLMFAGAHAISPEIHDFLPDREFSGLTEDVYIPAVRDDGPRLAGYQKDGLWFDVGTPARYMEATRGLLAAAERGDLMLPAGNELIAQASIAHQSAKIRGTVSRSSIGKEARVDRSSEVTDSVLWDRVETGAGTRIESAILAHDVRLPDRAHVRNCLVVPAQSETSDGDDNLRFGDWDVRAIDESQPFVFRAG